MFSDLQWFPDRVRLNEVEFLLESSAVAAAGHEDHFKFYKTRRLVDQYQLYFERRRGEPIRNVFELGIYDGGSTAFWFELLKPDKHVAIDSQVRDDSPYFKHWLSTRGIAGQVRTYWHTNQADRAELRRIARANIAGPLDLVIDDASHLYGPSRASFETLFPLLRPGGSYLIEDWAWDHWSGFSEANHPWAHERRLTDLIVELIEAAGTSGDLIARIEVFQGFVAVERGPLVLHAGSDFHLDDHIQRRSEREVREAPYRSPSTLQRLSRRLRRLGR